MARHLYLVCYDIRNPRRLARVLREVARYAGGGQKSVRECWLDTADRKALAREVTDRMDLRVDRFLLLRFDPRMHARELGRAAVAIDDTVLVVA